MAIDNIAVSTVLAGGFRRYACRLCLGEDPLRRTSTVAQPAWRTRNATADNDISHVCCRWAAVCDVKYSFNERGTSTALIPGVPFEARHAQPTDWLAMRSPVDPASSTKGGPNFTISGRTTLYVVATTVVLIAVLVLLLNATIG